MYCVENRFQENATYEKPTEKKNSVAFLTIEKKKIRFIKPIHIWNEKYHWKNVSIIMKQLQQQSQSNHHNKHLYSEYIQNYI